MKKIVGTVGAYLAGYNGYTIRDIERLVSEGKTAQALIGLTMWENDCQPPKEWVKIGDAKIVIDLLPDQDIVDSHITALKGEIKNIKAEAEVRISTLNATIDSLLAIENNLS